MKNFLLLWRDIPQVLRVTIVFVVVLWSIGIACILTGCATPAVRLDHSARLMARPDFPVARDAAPEWCRDALKTINRLEADLERR